ncbi:hypothetical protein [Pseudidiomarina salilacus]|uniref:hypothetical protein n=1 Tax=Pseudidiomarina salilacus TaxID=3384452 RepID=UPI003985075A
MKWLLMIFASMVISYSPTAKACSFRISGGELIRCGMTKIEVMNKIGNLDMRDRQTIGVNTGFGRGGRSAEAWSYVVKGDIGGEYYLTVLFSGNKVVEIESQQVRR